MILNFELSPDHVGTPSEVSIEWRTSGATSVQLLQEDHALDTGEAAAGTLVVHVEATTTFTLVASNAAGETASSSRTVVLEEGFPGPYIGRLSGPAVVTPDEAGRATLTVSWAGVARANELHLHLPGREPVELDPSPGEGSAEVVLTKDTTLVLIAANDFGEFSSSLHVQVAGPPSIERFEADRSLVGYGETVQLDWIATDAISVELRINGIEEEELDRGQIAGTFEVPIFLPSSLELRATNAAGIAVSSTMEIGVGAPMIRALNLDPESIWLGEDLEVSWTTEGGSYLSLKELTTGAELCELSAIPEIREFVCTWTPAEAGVYPLELFLSNSSGAIFELGEVLVGAGAVIEEFSVAPSETSVGEELELSWLVHPDPAGNPPSLKLSDDRGTSYLANANAGTLKLIIEEPGPLRFTLEAVTSDERSVPSIATALANVQPLPTVLANVTPEHFDDSTASEVEVRWTTEHAASLVLELRVGSSTGGADTTVEISDADRRSGRWTFTPSEDTSIRLIASNELGAQTTAEFWVTVAATDVIRFDADPRELTQGQPVTLSWKTQMADLVTIDGPGFGDTYLLEELAEPYVDIEPLGGQRVALRSCGGAIATAGCGTIDFPAAFRFPYGGFDWAKIGVYSQGFLTFDADTPAATPTTIQRIPTDRDTSWIHLFPLWDYLAWDERKYPDGNILYAVIEDKKGKALVIQWKDVGVWERSGRLSGYIDVSINFQVFLREDGSFEYRYGSYVIRATEIPKGREALQRAAIGFQLPDGTDSDELAFQGERPLLGPLPHRSFSYRPFSKALPRSGELLWHPYSTSQEFKATLTASRAASKQSKELTLEIAQKPTVDLSVDEIGKATIGEEVVVGWKTFNSHSLIIVDESGAERCSATEINLEEGACALSEPAAGIYEYIVQVGGAHGALTERRFSVEFSGEVGISYFAADSWQVEAGSGVMLDWITLGVERVVLLQDDRELASWARGGPGSFYVERLEEEATFTLQAFDSSGRALEESLIVSIWEVEIRLDVDRTNVRPGEAVTVKFEARGVGGEHVDLHGILPLVERLDQADRFVDISGRNGAQRWSQAPRTQRVELPFSFPFMGEGYSAAWIATHGYLSFGRASEAEANNVSLPSPDHEVHLAPFWDSLNPLLSGEIWAVEVDGSFIIQWSNYGLGRSQKPGDSGDLNFQVVLFPDGAFEYRYGVMKAGKTDESCRPTPDCSAEAMGSSATIGYQEVGGGRGHSFHFGGTLSGADNPVVSGGLAHRTFRYPRALGIQELTFHPSHTEDYVFCAVSRGAEVCKSLSIRADFGLELVTVAPVFVTPGGSTTISWQSRGGSELLIRSSEDVVFRTTDLGRVDSGAWVANPSSDTTYEIELRGGSRLAKTTRHVEVGDHKLTAQVTQSAGPGEPVTLSWDLESGAGELAPSLITPMEEVQADFYELDLSSDPAAQQLIGANSNNQNIRLEFKNGFVFPFFGVELRSIQVTTDGFLSTTTAASTNNADLPLAAHAGKLLLPFWDDLHTRVSGRVFAKPLGSDRYIIQWSRMSLGYGSSDSHEGNLNFMVVLHRDGSFEYRYGVMSPPSVEPLIADSCFPTSCLLESNGSSSTIGYMEPSGQHVRLIHFGGINRAPEQNAIAGGLSNRSWRFTPFTKGGSITVHPADTTTYAICLLETTNGSFTCASAVEVEVPWGIDLFTMVPADPKPGEEITLSWKVMGLDSLKVLDGETELEVLTGEGIPRMGSVRTEHKGPTTYTLVGGSMNRSKSESIVVSPHVFDLSVAASATSVVPGEKIEIEWELVSDGVTEIAMVTPMTEVDTTIETASSYLDISELEEAELVTFSGPTGSFRLELPFAFPYLGTSQTSLHIFTHGYLSFAGAGGNGNAKNVLLPSEIAASNGVHLAPFWDEFQRRGSEAAYVYSPNRELVIVQWSRFNLKAGSSSANIYDLNFQVVLHSDGRFEYRYGRMRAPQQPFSSSSCGDGDCRDEANGSSATIGYQDMEGRFGSTLHVGSMAFVALQENKVAPNPPDSYLPVPGGLEGRTFAYRPEKRGSSTVHVGRSGNYEVCGVHPEQAMCRVVKVETVADGGDLAVTELMIDPAGGAGAQWFEVRNLSTRTLDLGGFTVHSKGGSHAIEGPLLIASGAFKTFAASHAVGFSPDYLYGSDLPLDRLQDRLEIRAGAASISLVKWGVNWAVPRDQALRLEASLHEPGVLKREEFSQWCGGDGQGSPGELGPSCRSVSYHVDTISSRPFLDISRSGTRLHELEGSHGLARVPFLGAPLRFAGGRHSQLWATSYGWLSLSDGAPAASGKVGIPPEFPRKLTSTSPIGPLVSAVWGGIQCDRREYDCRFLFETLDVGGDSVLVLQWESFQFKDRGSITFQVQFWANGDVVVAFDKVDNPHSILSTDWLSYQGHGMWIGVEGAAVEDYTTGHFKRVIDLEGRAFHFIQR